MFTTERTKIEGSSKALNRKIDSGRSFFRVSAPPAEREASGSPPEGGDDFGKAPLGLFNRHQILTPIVSFRSFLALECN